VQSLAEVSALWGVPPPTRRPTLPVLAAGVVEVVSSQECPSPRAASPAGEAPLLAAEEVAAQSTPAAAAAAAAAPGASAQQAVIWVDLSKMVLMHDGEPYPLAKGPAGFCVAQVGPTTLATEVPNLMLDPPAPCKPAAVCKRPAAAPASAAKRAKKAAPPPPPDEATEEGLGEEEEEEEQEEEEAEEQPEEAEPQAPPPQGGLPETQPTGGEPQAAPAPDATPPPPARSGQQWHKMFYKAPRNAWAIRQARGAKRQVCQFSMTSLGVEASTAERIVDGCIAMLNSGRLPEIRARAWCLERFVALSAGKGPA
jgi:hypothetical protein